VLLLTVTLGGLFALAALSYWRGAAENPGITTEIALVSTALLGGLAVTQPGLAAGIAVAVAILLNARTALHRFARAVLSEAEIKDALTFAAATLIVLPLLPNREMGPYGALNPHSIWIIVILVMAIGAIGHIAVRLAGSRFGLPVAGFASGFISGTATIGSMGARAAQARDLLWPASAGAVLSSIGTIVQLVLLLAATNVSVLAGVAVPLALAGSAAVLYGILIALFALRHEPGPVDERGRAFNPWAAGLFAATLSAILLASRAMNDWYGESGILATAAVAGLVSADPAAIAVAELANAGKLEAAEAALPILITLSANTAVKAVLAFGSGGRAYALRVVPGLALMLLAAWSGWTPAPR
ncbi:MAG TPA: DUF4010 domain-containing protein, partial [Methylocella sp.]|nr:DUF4010 domain-containing protein [Methylocella sp.]